MDEIIREAGLSAGAVYGHFDSKLSLVLSAIDLSLGTLKDLLDPIFDREPSSLGALTTTLVETIRVHADRSGYDLKRIAVHGWSVALREDAIRHAINAHYRDVQNRIAATARRLCHDDRDAALQAELIMAVLFGSIVRACIMGGMEPAALQGLGGKPQP